MKLQYFNLSEFDCKETGENNMYRDFLRRLDKLRPRCGFSFIVTSGYRSPNHSAEKKKVAPGQHSKGVAADIYITDASLRFKIVKEALAMGFTGIGIAKTFIHVDDRDGTPVIWTY